MPKRKKPKRTAPETPDPGTVEDAGPMPPPTAEGVPGAPGLGLVEPPEEAVQRLSAELEELQDRYLRMVAEFDNYRKRMIRERREIEGRSQAQLASNVLDALDDLARVARLDPGEASASDIISGVELVERKLIRELGVAGLVRVGTVGQPFDPNDHEAVGAVPTSAPEQDGTIADVIQVGYRFAGSLLRPARVRVYMADALQHPKEGSGG